MSTRARHEIRGDLKSAVLGTLAGWAMKLVVNTLHVDVHDHCGIGSANAPIPPVIYVMWHNRIFTVPAVWHRLCGSHRRSVTLTSASHDGDMVARAMAVFGLGSVRGSSSRRAVAALIGLKRALLEGFDVCVTPDGPRGPRYRIHPGIIKLAQSTGVPIVPVHVRFGAAWRLKTWDRFVIPKPFSRVEVTFAQAIVLPRAMDAEAFENATLHLESLLIEGTDDA